MTDWIGDGGGGCVQGWRAELSPHGDACGFPDPPVFGLNAGQL